MTDADELLGHRLADLRDHIAPTDTDLAPAVRTAIGRAPVRSLRPLAAAAAVIVIAVMLTAFAPARTAVAGWLGIGNTRVDVVDSFPEATPTTPPPSSTTPGATGPSRSALPDETLTGPVLARETQDLAGDEEFLVRYADVTFSATSAESEITIIKSVTDAQAVTSAIVTDGSPALWIDGAHTRTVGDITTLVEASTLIWVRGGYEYRLTGDISRELAVMIAESIE